MRRFGGTRGAYKWLEDRDRRGHDRLVGWDVPGVPGKGDEKTDVSGDRKELKVSGTVWERRGIAEQRGSTGRW